VPVVVAVLKKLPEDVVEGVQEEFLLGINFCIGSHVVLR
jgi:hypothetical protein